MDVVSNLLSGGKNSRLYKRLVYDLQIAQDVNAVQQSQALDSNFVIIATARPGQSLDKIQAVIDEELDKLRKTAPEPREIARAQPDRSATSTAAWSASADSAARPTS